MGMSGYYGTVRSELFPYLPEGERGLRVLELGCGSGVTGARLKALGRAAHVTGVEYVEEAAQEARAVLDTVYHADLATFVLPEEAGTFDLLLCPDVIEHLVSPETILRRMVGRVRPGGWVLTSTPNVRYWRIVYDLAVRGRWDYADAGILDRTHVRFFTKHSILGLHRDLGLEVEAFGYTELAGKRALLDRVTGGRLRDLLCGQHVVRSRRP
jgi:SAM-dependent methyltransferase